MQPPVSLVRRVALTLVLWPASLAGQQVPALSLTRDLRIDAAEHDLTTIGWVAVAPNGTMVASQAQDNRVVFFDTRGAALGSFGRAGAGPGEFRSLAMYGWLGDTLWIRDLSTRRVTLISPGRALVRTIPWPTNIPFDTTGLPAPRISSLWPRALYPDGSMLVDARLSEGSPPIPGSGPAREGTAMVRLARDGRFGRIMTWAPERGCTVSFSMQGGFGAAAIPFCTTPLSDLAPDGSRFVLATAEDVNDRTGFYRVVLVRERGDTAFSRRFAFTPVAIPKRVADSVIAQRTGGRAAPEFIAAYRSMKVPSTFPPLDRVVLGRDETTWIEHYTFSGDRQWTVLGGSGAPIGRLTLPRNIRVQQASRDVLWATETDEDGLQHIVRFRVTGANGT